MSKKKNKNTTISKTPAPVATETKPAEDETPIVVADDNGNVEAATVEEVAKVAGLEPAREETGSFVAVDVPAESQPTPIEHPELDPAQLRQKQVLELRQGIATLANSIRLLENQIGDAKREMGTLGAKIANL